MIEVAAEQLTIFNRNTNCLPSLEKFNIICRVFPFHLPDDFYYHVMSEGELSDPDLQSEPEQRKFITVKAIGKEAATSELIKRPRGRPRKIMKQTNESTKTVKAIGKEAVTSDAIKPPRGRPWEIEKQTSERTETVKAIGKKSNHLRGYQVTEGGPRKNYVGN